jgi:hypothetical protein
VKRRVLTVTNPSRDESQALESEFLNRLSGAIAGLPGLAATPPNDWPSSAKILDHFCY